jgi:hypothetical protein
MPEWQKAKNELSDLNILAAEVESENLGLLPPSVSSIRGFPTLLILKNGKAVKEYTGDRTVSDVVSFAKKFAGPKSTKAPAQKLKSSSDSASKGTKKEKAYKGKEKKKN